VDKLLRSSCAIACRYAGSAFLYHPPGKYQQFHIHAIIIITQRNNTLKQSAGVMVENGEDGALLRVSFDRVVRLKSSNRRIIGGVIPFEE
jgi:hypothetical protein